MRKINMEGKVLCCENCKASCTDFKKVIDLKGSGLGIYVHAKKDEQKKAGASKYDDTYILHNTSGKQIKRLEYIKELRRFKTKCSQCNIIAQKVRSLLDEARAIGKNEVIGVCEHCKRANVNKTCKRCDFIVSKFISMQEERFEEKQQRFKVWLCKVKQLLQAILDEESMCQHRVNYKDTELERILHELEEPINVREPDIDFFLPLDQEKLPSLQRLSKSKEKLKELLSKIELEDIKPVSSHNSIYPSPSKESCLCKYVKEGRLEREAFGSGTGKSKESKDIVLTRELLSQDKVSTRRLFALSKASPQALYLNKELLQKIVGTLNIAIKEELPTNIVFTLINELGELKETYTHDLSKDLNREVTQGLINNLNDFLKVDSQNLNKELIKLLVDLKVMNDLLTHELSKSLNEEHLLSSSKRKDLAQTLSNSTYMDTKLLSKSMGGSKTSLASRSRELTLSRESFISIEIRQNAPTSKSQEISQESPISPSVSKMGRESLKGKVDRQGLPSGQIEESIQNLPKVQSKQSMQGLAQSIDSTLILSEELGNDAKQGTPIDQITDGKQDLSRSQSKKSIQGLLKPQSIDSTPILPKELSTDATQFVSTDQTTDGKQDLSRGLSKKSMQGLLKAQSKDSTPILPKGLSTDAKQGVSTAQITDGKQDLSRGLSKKSMQGLLKAQSKDSTPILPKGLSTDAKQGVSTAQITDGKQDLSRGQSKKSMQGLLKAQSKDSTPILPKGLSTDTKQGVSTDKITDGKQDLSRGQSKKSMQGLLKAQSKASTPILPKGLSKDNKGDIPTSQSKIGERDLTRGQTKKNMQGLLKAESKSSAYSSPKGRSKVSTHDLSKGLSKDGMQGIPTEQSQDDGQDLHKVQSKDGTQGSPIIEEIIVVKKASSRAQKEKQLQVVIKAQSKYDTQSLRKGLSKNGERDLSRGQDDEQDLSRSQSKTSMQGLLKAQSTDDTQDLPKELGKDDMQDISIHQIKHSKKNLAKSDKSLQVLIKAQSKDGTQGLHKEKGQSKKSTQGLLKAQSKDGTQGQSKGGKQDLSKGQSKDGRKSKKQDSPKIEKKYIIIKLQQDSPRSQTKEAAAKSKKLHRESMQVVPKKGVTRGKSQVSPKDITTVSKYKQPESPQRKEMSQKSSTDTHNILVKNLVKLNKALSERVVNRNLMQELKVNINKTLGQKSSFFLDKVLKDLTNLCKPSVQGAIKVSNLKLVQRLIKDASKDLDQDMSEDQNRIMVQSLLNNLNTALTQNKKDLRRSRHSIKGLDRKIRDLSNRQLDDLREIHKKPVKNLRKQGGSEGKKSEAGEKSLKSKHGDIIDKSGGDGTESGTKEDISKSGKSVSRKSFTIEKMANKMRLEKSSKKAKTKSSEDEKKDTETEYEKSTSSKKKEQKSSAVKIKENLSSEDEKNQDLKNKSKQKLSSGQLRKPKSVSQAILRRILSSKRSMALKYKQYKKEMEKKKKEQMKGIPSSAQKQIKTPPASLEGMSKIRESRIKRTFAPKFMISGEALTSYNSRYKDIKGPKEPEPLFFKTQLQLTDDPIVKQELEHKEDIDIAAMFRDGIFRYKLSNREFIDKGWTKLPTKKIMRRMNIYRMEQAYPQNDWFKRHKDARELFYDSGVKLADIDRNGRGRWYYRNGNTALEYYNAQESNIGQRYVVYSSGTEMDCGKLKPRTILGLFDALGNGIVYDHYGKVRLKYNQSEGVLLDPKIGPPGRWKWHTLNDPPVLQQALINVCLKERDPNLERIPKPERGQDVTDFIPEPHPEMLAIELDNFVKEKTSKLMRKFRPFQIRMKAVKMNEQFSLKILDQANIYLLYRDGTTSLKLGLGMLLISDEIIDTETADMTDVATPYDRYPAKSLSVENIQKILKTVRSSKLRPPPELNAKSR